jgi:hypothetical protein
MISPNSFGNDESSPAKICRICINPGTFPCKNADVASSSLVGRFGDMISETTLDSIQSFERRNRARLVRDGIQSDFLETEDLTVFLSYKVFLMNPTSASAATISSNRLEIEITKASTSKWAAVYASDSLWASRLLHKPLVRDIIIRTYSQLRLRDESLLLGIDSVSYVQLLARTIDLAHPNQKLQTVVMAYPFNAIQTIKKRLVQLGYNLGSSSEDSPNLDLKSVIDYVKQINKRLDTEHRFYFEFTTPHRMAWRVGFTSSCGSYGLEHQQKYPGQDDMSLGISHDGYVFFNGQKTR